MRWPLPVAGGGSIKAGRTTEAAVAVSAGQQGFVVMAELALTRTAEVVFVMVAGRRWAPETVMSQRRSAKRVNLAQRAAPCSFSDNGVRVVCCRVVGCWSWGEKAVRAKREKRTM